MNTNSAVLGDDGEIFRSMYKTVSDTFPHTAAFVVNHAVAGDRNSTNIILVAWVGEQELQPADWQARAAQYSSLSNIDSLRLRQMVGDHLDTLPDLSEAPVFTDDYAPLETMSF
jgi:hypothetical protein